MMTAGILAVTVCLMSTVLAHETNGTCRPCRQPPQCRKVKTVPVTFELAIPLSSPFYEKTTISNSRTILEDSACYTFFPLTKKSFFVIRYAVLIYGNYTVGSYIMTDVPGSPGVVREEGLPRSASVSTRIANNYIVGIELTCSVLFGLSKCFHYEDCNTLKTPYVLAATDSPDPLICLLDGIEKTLVEAAGEEVEFVRKPYKRPYKCVTSFNGASCINEHKVPDAHRVSLPMFTVPSRPALQSVCKEEDAN